MLLSDSYLDPAIVADVTPATCYLLISPALKSSHAPHTYVRTVPVGTRPAPRWASPDKPPDSHSLCRRKRITVVLPVKANPAGPVFTGKPGTIITSRVHRLRINSTNLYCISPFDRSIDRFLRASSSQLPATCFEGTRFT